MIKDKQELISAIEEALDNYGKNENRKGFIAYFICICLFLLAIIIFGGIFIYLKVPLVDIEGKKYTIVDANQYYSMLDPRYDVTIDEVSEEEFDQIFQDRLWMAHFYNLKLTLWALCIFTIIIGGVIAFSIWNSAETKNLFNAIIFIIALLQLIVTVLAFLRT